MPRRRSAAKPAVAEAAIDKALALPDLKPQQIQQATIVKSNCCLARKDYQASLDCLRKAFDAAPKGQNADALKGLIQRSEKLLEAGKRQRRQTPAGRQSCPTTFQSRALPIARTFGSPWLPRWCCLIVPS